MMKIITAISILSLISLTGTAYALEDENGNVMEVEINTFPFEVTLVEEGTIVFTSDVNRTMKSDISTFELKAGEPYSLVLDPILDSSNTDGWYVKDVSTGEYSIIHTVDFYVPPPEPVYVPEPIFVPEPVVELVVEEVVEPTPEINFGATSSETIGTFETISNSTFVEPIIVEPTGIQNVATYEGEVDLITMQTKLAEVTLSFNESIQKIADQKQQLADQTEKLSAINATIVSLQTDRESLSSQVTSLKANTTAIDTKNDQISILEANIVSLTSDRDQWKALANNWYGVAMSQLEVMVNVLGL
ncbi:DUF3450 domain-containing protein [bacterium]|nr:DUF3450 domain-containing protein [bacterium]